MKRTALKDSILPDDGRLGTFAGVFTPSVLTILGIILFLRLGYVVGNAGIGRALVIIALANVISIFTSVSLSAIATNLKVKGGGDYYLISRTLGVEFGGAIGLVLFLAQSVSIAFYCIGFGEAINAIAPGGSPRIISILAVGFLFIFAWLGADWATKFQYLVMVLLAAALISFFVGGIPHWNLDVLVQNWQPPPNALPFWVLFAIFFPAVTGFTQGVSMSGDLKAPSKSLPLGTFLAVGVSIVIYFGGAVLFAGVLPNDILSADYQSMKKVARFGVLIDCGVVAATLSSAMASFLGAPRILQSLAGDRIFKILGPFETGVGPNNNPRRGVLLSAGIALIAIALGQLNLIAQLVSMFFLISYGLLNYATYYEARAASPSFRPRFKWFHYRLSAAGFITCLGVMVAIDPKSSAGALAIIFGIYQFLKRTSGPARWADGRRSYHMQRVRENLLVAADSIEHPRDWRPIILVMTNDQPRRAQILTFAQWVEGGSGLTTAVKLIVGKGVTLKKHKDTAEKELKADISRNHHKAFPLVVGVEDISEDLPTLIQSFGIGPLRANTMLVNWLGQLGQGIPTFNTLKYIKSLQTIFRQGLNLIILNTDNEKWDKLLDTAPENRRIDVWWRGDATSRLMLLCAHLILRNDAWDQGTIRVLCAGGSKDPEKRYEVVKETISEWRIEATPFIVPEIETKAIVEMSRDAAVVFVPFQLKKYEMLDVSGYSLRRILNHLPVTALVKAAEDIDLDAEPEEGEAGEIAAALDQLSDVEKKARLAEKEADEAKKVAAAHEEKAKMSLAASQDPQSLKALLDEAQAAAKEAEKAMRRAAKARIKAEKAAKFALTIGAMTDIENSDSAD